MAVYREIPPPAPYAETIECFWTTCDAAPGELHRVVPDGCADILFTLCGGAAALDAVGPMTTWRDYPAVPNQFLLGVRFRPGMWTAALKTAADRLTDEIIPLDALWGAQARALLTRLRDAETLHRRLSAFTQFLSPADPRDPVARALACLARHHGAIPLDDLARHCGLSPRQFRRRCLERAGLSPKMLARILRFRYSRARLSARPVPLAQFALECGYCDQAHFTNEFREFCGRTPAGERA